MPAAPAYNPTATGAGGPVEVFWEDASDSGSEAGRGGWAEEEEPPPPPPAAAERRVDPADGQLYTKEEFEACYNGAAEWDAAAGRPASPAASAGPGAPPPAAAAAEERRVDASDGGAYTHAEFVACYGDAEGEEEWAAAAPAGRAAAPAVSEDPDCACAYCGACDTAAVARCAATGRWFCNGAGARPRGGGPADGASHAVLHMVLSGHTELSLHRESPLGEAQLACFHCGAANACLLGFVPHRSDESVVLLCRDPCLHTCGIDEARDPSLWKPLVGDDKRLLPWLLREPLGASAEAAGAHGLGVWRRLEQLWQTDPGAAVEDAVAAAQGQRQEGAPLHFADGGHVQRVFLPLLQVEADEDRRATERRCVDGVRVTWRDGGREGVFEYYPGDGVRLLPGDDVRLRSGGAVPWEAEARVAAAAPAAGQGALELTVRLRAPPRGAPPRGEGQWRVSPVWRPTTVGRMRRALAAFADDDAACGEAVYHQLLGHGDRWEEPAPPYGAPAPVSVDGLPELNHSQAAAVRGALRAPLSLIQGPPGTGKTTTAAALLYHLARGHPEGPRGGRALACAPSNFAADHVALQAHAVGLRVLRVVSQARERDPDVSSRADFLSLTAQVAALVAADPELARLARLRDGGGGLAAPDAKLLRRHEAELEHEALAAADVVATTCASAADPRIAKLRFAAVLIDEATQATEPEGLIPLTQGAERVVLIGDHCQLGPVVVSKEAALAGLSRSTFERLVQLGVAPARLCVQYRMHPALSRWPSGAFYDGALQNGVVAAQRAAPGGFAWPRADAPLCFCHVAAPEELAASGTSYVNRREAALVADAVRLLVAGRTPPGDIAVLTPYEGQRLHVAAALGRAGGGADHVEVSSIDAFQGREKDVVILTCVRSNEQQGIGFLNDPKRLNVSLTRALRGLIVVGNARVLSRDAVWHGFLEHCREEGVLAEPARDGQVAALRKWDGALAPPRHPPGGAGGRAPARAAPPRRRGEWETASEAEPPISQRAEDDIERLSTGGPTLDGMSVSSHTPSAAGRGAGLPPAGSTAGSRRAPPSLLSDMASDQGVSEA